MKCHLYVEVTEESGFISQWYSVGNSYRHSFSPFMDEGFCGSLLFIENSSENRNFDAYLVEKPGLCEPWNGVSELQVCY